jgi:hypothetical protein
MSHMWLMGSSGPYSTFDIESWFAAQEAIYVAGTSPGIPHTESKTVMLDEQHVSGKNRLFVSVHSHNVLGFSSQGCLGLLKM